MNILFITKLVKFCLYGLMAISLLNIFSSMGHIKLLNDYFVSNLYSSETFDALAQKNDDRHGLINFVHVTVIFSSFVIIGRWFYVSAKINHLSEIKGLKITPGWAVGWYFIPIASLIMPYRSLKETFKASFDTEDWQSTKVPYDFPIWWATFLISGGLGIVSSNMLGSLGETYPYEKLKEIFYITITSDFLLIINAFYLLRIVDTVFNNQKGKNFQTK